MSKIDIFLLDNLNNTKEELKTIKPKTYIDLIIQLKQEIKNLPQNYETFILDKDNKEIKINNEEKYKKTDDTIFIRELTQEKLEQSILEINSNNLSESNQLISEENCDCILCSVIIQNEKPYLCYKCQRIFHKKCLKEWDSNFKEKNNNTLLCPNCKEELPFERWNKKLDYGIYRKDIENLKKKMNEYKLKNNMNDNLIIIKDKKINELKDEINNKSERLKKYEKDMNKGFEIYRNILNKINSINNSLNLESNDKINNLINQYHFNSDNLDDISSEIIQELELLKTHLLVNIFNYNSRNNMQMFPGFNPINFSSPPQFPSQFQQPMFPYQPVNQEEQMWDIIFESKIFLLHVLIGNNKTLEEAIEKYRIMSGDMVSTKFTHNGKPLDHKITLNQSGLSNKSIIHVGEKFPPPEPYPSMENGIILKFEMTAGGNVTNIEIQSDKLVGDAINEYKNMLHAEYQLKFIFNGLNLDEKLTLKEAGLKNGSRILVINTKDIHGPGGP